MSAMAGIVAKVAVFLVATLVGGTIALGVTGSLSARSPVTKIGRASCRERV